MAWYDTGTVSVTNGSTTVTGLGTNFISGVQIGEAFYGPDGRFYEIQAVVSATVITLADSYLGSTQSGQSYKIVPTQSLVADLTNQVSSLISDFQSVKDEAGEGKFDDGTTALPGVTFNLDQDTGFSRPATNQLATSTGGIQRTLLSNTAYQVNVPITGTAVQSGFADATLGKVLLNGAHGLGAKNLQPDLSISDIDDPEIPTGFYSVNAPTGTLPAGTATVGTLVVFAYSATAGGATFQSTQMYYPRRTNHEHFQRAQRGGVFDRWVRVYDQDSVVGTVSQSGGDPTGAVVERGSNANGEYIRFADGTQICWNSNAAITTNPATFTGTVTDIDGSKLRIGRWF